MAKGKGKLRSVKLAKLPIKQEKAKQAAVKKNKGMSKFKNQELVSQLDTQAQDLYDALGRSKAEMKVQIVVDQPATVQTPVVDLADKLKTL